MLHTLMPKRSYIKSGSNLNLSSIRNHSDYNVLRHLYKQGGIYIQRKSYCLSFCATIVWSFPFDLVSHFEFRTSTVSSPILLRGYLYSKAIILFIILCNFCLVESLRACFTLWFWTSTFSSNKGFKSLFATGFK